MEYERHNYREAEGLVRRSLRDGDKGDVESRRLLMAALRHQGPQGQAGARRAVDAALGDFPGDPGLLQEQATLDYVEGKYDASLAHFRDAAGINRYDVRALIGQSTAYRAMCRPRQAEELIGNACDEWDRKWKDPALHKEHGLTLYSLGKYEDSAGEFRQSLEVAYDEEALAGLVDALRGSRRYSEARALVNHGMFTTPDESELIEALVQSDASSKQAKVIAANLTSRHGDANEVLLRLASARLYEELGNLELALDDAGRALEEAERAYPLNDPARLVSIAKHIRILSKLGKSDQARRFGETERAKQPEALLIACELALCYRRSYAYAEMLDVMTAARKKDARDPAVRQLACVASWELHDWRAAERNVRDALRELREVAGLWSELGWVLYGQRRWSEAWEAFAEAQRQDPRDERAIIGTSESLLMLGRDKEAVRLLEENLGRYGDRDDVRLALGRAQLGDGRGVKDAEDTFLALLERRPGIIRAHRMLALARFRSEHEAASGLVTTYQCQAEQGLRTAIALDPRDPMNEAALAWVLTFGVYHTDGKESEEGRLREAQQLCEDVLRRDKQSAMAIACLGVVHWHLDHLQAAEDYLRHATEMDIGHVRGVWSSPGGAISRSAD